MKLKNLNINTIKYLPYQEPIKKGAIITDWYVKQARLKHKIKEIK